MSKKNIKISNSHTPYAIICVKPEHGRIFLTTKEYNRQMNNPNDLWECPICNKEAMFDDVNFEKY